ncbi:ATP-binding protein [Streptomyces griseoincarnatus]
MPRIPLVPLHWHLPAHPTSVRRARHAVTASLPHALRPDLGDDLGLLTSELVTNAILHGADGKDGDLIELVLWPADGHYWLAVSDPGNGNRRWHTRAQTRKTAAACSSSTTSPPRGPSAPALLAVPPWSPASHTAETVGPAERSACRHGSYRADRPNASTERRYCRRVP